MTKKKCDYSKSWNYFLIALVLILILVIAVNSSCNLTGKAFWSEWFDGDDDGNDGIENDGGGSEDGYGEVCPGSDKIAEYMPYHEMTTFSNSQAWNEVIRLNELGRVNSCSDKDINSPCSYSIYSSSLINSEKPKIISTKSGHCSKDYNFGIYFYFSKTDSLKTQKGEIKTTTFISTRPQGTGQKIVSGEVCYCKGETDDNDFSQESYD